MIFEITKQRIIKGLSEEIECLTAVPLELVGHNVVSILENKKLIHHGINKDYKPSGYTVDSFSNNSLIVAEYSTEKGYFDDTSKKGATVPFFEKIEKDITHAVNHCQTSVQTKIYLISSQEEPPSFRSKFNSTSIAKKYKDIVVIYDSRELAKLIYDQSLFSQDFISYYQQFFPGFSQNLNNFEYYGKIPSFCKNHISDKNAIQQIKKYLSKKDICVISGMSGSGKTQLAIDYIHGEKNNFENYIWISGDDWVEDTSLSSIKRNRGGATINIPGLFNSYKTILVIDSYNKKINIDALLSELSIGIEKGAKIIITSQITASSAEGVIVPEISYDTAVQIIGEKVGCESELARNVINLCKCSPLILSTIRSFVEHVGVDRNNLYQDILNHPNNITDDGGELVMKRILSKLEDNMRVALSRIANSGSTIHDSKFLDYYIGPLNRVALQRLSLLLPSGLPECLKIHDLVCKSVQDNQNTKEISESIASYVEKNNTTMSPSVIRQIHLCYDTIISEHNSRADVEPDWLTYTILQVEGSKKLEIIEELSSKVITADMGLPCVLSIIDAKEAYSYSINDDEKKKYYEKCIDEYLQVINISSDDELKMELLHHLGKAYRRSGKPKESLDCFLKIISSNNKQHAAYLQIAHLGSQREDKNEIKEVGEEHLKKLIDNIIEDYLSVPLRVSLGAFNKLRSYYQLKEKIKESSEKVEKIANIIALSSFEGFGQFFEAFVAFTSMFGYHHSEICVKLIENSPELLSIPPELIEENQWTNACEALANISDAATREGKVEFSYKVIGASLLFADKILQYSTLKSYPGRVIAKAYIIGDKPNEALMAIGKVPHDKRDHWLIYNEAKVLMKVDAVKALQSAKKALDMILESPKDCNYISSYHDLYSKCAQMNDDLELAIQQAELAYKKCNDAKYKAELDKRLNDLRGSICS